jgi:hypothetical protein
VSSTGRRRRDVSRAGIGATSRASKVGVVSAPLVGRAGRRSSTGGRRRHRIKAGGAESSGVARGRGAQAGRGAELGSEAMLVTEQTRADGFGCFFSNAKVSHLGKILFSGTTPLRSAPFEPNTIEMELSRSVP